jgi:hypothetical protein
MAPRKRARTAAAASSTDSANASANIRLSGGHAKAPRTIEKFRTGKLCDIELKAANGTSFHAHILCLTAGSGYFEALYANDWADASGSLTLPEVPSEALAACLEFIYVGEATVGSEAQLMTVLEAAAYLQMPELTDAAAAALTKLLGPTNALHVWQLADRLQGLGTLAEAAAASAGHHFASIISSEVWLSAPLNCIESLLASDRLVVGHEAQVYDAAVAWLRARAPPLGAEEAAALLSHVRYPLLSYDFYTQHVTLEDRLAAARCLLADFELADELAHNCFADGVDNAFDAAYASWPFRFWAVDALAVRLKAMPVDARYSLDDLERYLAATSRASAQ